MVANVLCIRKNTKSLEEEDIIGLHVSTCNLATTLKEGDDLGFRVSMAWFLNS
jgi:hypothetical protein